MEGRPKPRQTPQWSFSHPDDDDLQLGAEGEEKAPEKHKN